MNSQGQGYFVILWLYSPPQAFFDHIWKPATSKRSEVKMQAAPASHHPRKPLTFTESVLAQLRTWPWTEMVDTDPSTHTPSSGPIEIHSDAPSSSLSHNPPHESDDPEDSW